MNDRRGAAAERQAQDCRAGGAQDPPHGVDLFGGEGRLPRAGVPQQVDDLQDHRMFTRP
jgi:hypothetical protein